MRLPRRDRLWAICGLLVAVILVTGAWFLAIGPGYGQRSDLRAQTAAARSHLKILQRRISDLERQRDEFDKYQATLAEDRRALPETADLSEFLRQLQDAGSETGVTVSGLLVGAATKIPNSATEIFALPLTMTAAGTADQLGQFLDQLQLAGSRAVLISGLNAVTERSGGSTAMTLSFRVFVAPAPAGASGTPKASGAP